MITRTFHCKAKIEPVEQWCKENCQAPYAIGEIAWISYGNPLLEVVLSHDEDCVLFQMKWQSKAAEIMQTAVGNIAEPVFSLEELEAETQLRDARSYIIGSDRYNSKATNAAFAEEVKAWCENNLTDSVMFEPAGWNDSRIILGIPDGDDRLLFLMRWEGHKGPSGEQMVEHVKTFQWAAEVPEDV